MFFNCSSLVEIDIPDSIEIIPASAFAGCSSLTTVRIPESVTEICGLAFGNCSALAEIEIPKSVVKIGDFNFANGLVLYLGWSTPSGAFDGCVSLTGIKVHPDNTVFRDEDGVLFEGTELRKFPAGKKVKEYSIPDKTTKIGNEAFCDCSSLTKIVIPDSVTEIGARPFGGCRGLTEMIIPDSVTEVGSFDGCSSLTEITIPRSVESVSCTDFFGCPSLITVYLSKRTEFVENCSDYIPFKVIRY